MKLLSAKCCDTNIVDTSYSGTELCFFSHTTKHGPNIFIVIIMTGQVEVMTLILRFAQLYSHTNILGKNSWFLLLFLDFFLQLFDAWVCKFIENNSLSVSGDTIDRHTEKIGRIKDVLTKKAYIFSIIDVLLLPRVIYFRVVNEHTSKLCVTQKASQVQDVVETRHERSLVKVRGVTPRLRDSDTKKKQIVLLIWLFFLLDNRPLFVQLIQARKSLLLYSLNHVDKMLLLPHNCHSRDIVSFFELSCLVVVSPTRFRQEFEKRHSIILGFWREHMSIDDQFNNIVSLRLFLYLSGWTKKKHVLDVILERERPGVSTASCVWHKDSLLFEEA